jgi:mutator protein MutT
MFNIGAFAIIAQNDKILLCHRRDKDLWNLPGGKVEDGESPWEGVMREVKEEIGVDVSVNKLLGIYFKTEQNEIVFSFECSVKNGEPILSDEADEIKFFSLEEIPANTAPRQVERIKDYLLQNTKEVILRRH